MELAGCLNVLDCQRAQATRGNTPKDDPPHWLKVGDESWGPTDMRRREPRSLPPRPQLPRLPPRTRNPPSFRAALTALLLLLPAFVAGFWIQKISDSRSFGVYMAGMIGGLFLELIALVGFVWLARMFGARSEGTDKRVLRRK